jgi:hypothetical protein
MFALVHGGNTVGPIVYRYHISILCRVTNHLADKNSKQNSNKCVVTYPHIPDGIHYIIHFATISNTNLLEMNHDSQLSPKLALSGSTRKSSVLNSPRACISPPLFSRNRLPSSAGVSPAQRRCTLRRTPNLDQNHVSRKRCTSVPDVSQINTRPGRVGVGGRSENTCFRLDPRGFNQNCSSSNSFMTKLCIAQRSTSSKTVKKTLSDLQDSCDSSNTKGTQTARGGAAAPQSECALLAQLAIDDYYKVVIGKNKGILTICSVMRCYPDNASVQASCCTILHLLATSHQNEINQTGGVSLIVSALQNHSKSRQVQSVACEALRDMSLSIC